MPTAQVCVVCVELWCYWQRTRARSRICGGVERCCAAGEAGYVEQRVLFVSMV